MAPILSPQEDARTQLIEVLSDWDWSNYFPADYDAALPVGVQITTEFPADQLTNVEATVNGQLVKPVISVLDISFRSIRNRDGGMLGDAMDVGSTPGTIKRGQVLELMFQLDCWADLQVGAGDQAQRIGGGVLDCLFVNRNTLPSFRRLVVSGGPLIINDASQFWRYTLTVGGRLVQSYDR